MESNYKLNKNGVFGLESVKAFFAILLGLALLAFVIVVLLGVLQTSNVLVDSSRTVVNETGFINRTGYILSNSTIQGFNSPNIIIAINETGIVIASPNYTVSAAGNVTNASAASWAKVNFTYSYSFSSASELSANNILGNTSNGVAGFFSSVNPVYPILAILVIILVLVVLVRVTTGNISGNRQGKRPQL